MAGPWEKYQAQPQAAAPRPWERYTAAPAPTAAPVPMAAPQNTNELPWYMQGAATEAEAANLNAMHNAPRTAAQQEFDNLPWYMKPVQAADDLARMAANGITFGYADKLAGAASGTGTEAQRALSAEAADRSGSAGVAAEIGGSLALPGAAAKQGLSLIGRGGNALVRTGAAATEGAGYGALSAAGHDQDIATGALVGVGGGLAGKAAADALSGGVKAVSKVLSGKTSAPEKMTREGLDAAKDAAYKAAEDAGVVFNPTVPAKINAKVVESLSDLGYDPALQPGASVAIRRLQELEGQNVTLKGLDTVRKIASNGFIPGNNSNNAAVSRIVSAIDDAMSGAKADDFLMGDQAGTEILAQARKLASQSAKIGKVEDAIGRAELRAASTGKGANVDNATRQNLRRLLENPRGFTPAEREALERVVTGGGVGQETARWMSQFAPTGIVSTALTSGAGTLAAGPLGLALPVVGAGAKVVSDRMTAGNVQRLSDLILSGGVKDPQAVISGLPEEARNRIAKALAVSLSAQGAQ